MPGNGGYVIATDIPLSGSNPGFYEYAEGTTYTGELASWYPAFH